MRRKRAENSLRTFHDAEEARLFGRLVYTFVFGFFAGILCMVLKKERFLYDTGFLDSYTLSPVKYLEPDLKGLMQNVFLQRIGIAVLLIILSTTYLGCAASYFYQLWSGLALGIFMSGSMLRYGMKGLLLIAGSLLPQQVILLPAFLLLSAKCCELCRVMYFRGLTAGFSGKDRNRLLFQKIAQMGFIVMILIAGCLLEIYVNPKFLKYILQIF